MSQQLETEFRDYCSDILLLSSFSIDLAYSKLSNLKKKLLIGFCYASSQAYCALVYLRCENMYGTVTSYLVCSCTRVAPLKELTYIPRLEL